MFLTYVWQSKDLSTREAYARFSDIMRKQRDLYRDAWGRTPELDIHQMNDIMIGQLRYETGVKDWRAWIVQGNTGIVWGGICEEYLGCKYVAGEVKSLQTLLTERPREVCNWDGRFCVVTWDTDTRRLSLTTGVTESPSLWYTEGPNGWAIGSRASPILDMVDGKRTLSRKDVGLFLGYGYLIGNGSLFENVRRVRARQQVLFDGRSKPTIRTYVSMIDCLSLDQHPMDRQEAIQVCTSRIIERVGRQLQHSKDPWVLLTGGRDSRCIAAAAQKCEFSGPVHTGGTPESPDVRIAIEVAKRLQLRHQHVFLGDMESRMPALLGAPEYLKLWTKLSEGLETLRHATPFQGFFKRKLPFPAQRQPLFHGMGSGFGRGYYYSKRYIPSKKLNERNSGAAEETIFGRKFGQWGPSDKLAREELTKIFTEFNTEIDRSVSTALWLDLFFWQRKDLHWGEDMMSVKSPMWWHWTPLQDRELMRVWWHLPAADKMYSRFFEDVTPAIAPALEGLAYDSVMSWKSTTSKGLVAKILSRSERYAKLMLSKLRNTKSNLTNPYLLEFWELVLFNDGPRIWAEFTDEASIRAIMRKHPNADRLWNMATVELFAKTHCS